MFLQLGAARRAAAHWYRADDVDGAQTSSSVLPVMRFHMLRSLRSLDLNLLLVLESLLETRSVARTAASLSLSPSAVSHALSRLRSALADPLLVRGAKGLVPTPRALELGAPIGQALRQLEQTVAGKGFEPRTSARTFRIGTTDFGARELLPRLLASLAQLAPGIQIIARPLPLSIDAGLEGELDAMIGIASTESPHLYHRRLFTERWRCMARRGHPAVKHGKVSLDDYLAQGHILIAPRGQPSSRLDAVLAERGVSRRLVMLISDFLLGPFLVASTDLLLAGGHRFLASFEGVLPVEVIELPVELPSFDVSLVWHGRVHEDPAHRWLRELLFSLYDESPKGKASARPRRA
jgi:DNA-binding transcriptional LysR family regulator